VVLFVAALGVTLSGWRLWTVKSDLELARAEAADLRADVRLADVGKTRADLTSLALHANAANRASHALVLRIAGLLPIVGAQVHGVQDVTTATADVANRVLQPVASLSADLKDRRLFTDGTVDLAEVHRLGSLVDDASRPLRSSTQRLSASPSGSLLGPLARARLELLGQMRALSDQLASTGRVLDVLPAMLGENGARRYFIAVQNPAESRGTGGLTTGFAVMTVTAGHFSVSTSGTNLDVGPLTGSVDFPELYARLAAGGAARASVLNTWLGANVRPDWPTAAAITADLWAKHSGQQVDGVLGLGPPAIAAILKVAGPAHLSDGTTVTGDSAIQYMQVGQYSQFSASNSRRKRANAEFASVALGRLFAAKLSLGALIGLGRDLSGAQDVVLWSRHPEEEKLIQTSKMSGAMPVGPAFLQITAQNIAGGKMDAFVHRAVTVRRTLSGDRCVSRVSLRLINDAPPAAQLSVPQHQNVFPTREREPLGTTRTALAVYSDLDAVWSSASIDGVPVELSSQRELGRSLVLFNVSLRPHVPVKIDVELVGPTGRLTYRAQPLANPEAVTISGTC
jgi:hypothetical protein